ncbi:class I SAM-dependent methyltransferase [Micromonospora aurantiaca]|uniref:class I SAM-dependent methyltransferase n=1 Tax=Micromonospora aurantiaca (nom. illeg.) TaxID=47850 RepID=UPI0034533977
MSAQQSAARWCTPMTDPQRDRWSTVLGHVTSAIPAGSAYVLVDGHERDATVLADRLAAALRDAGRPRIRLSRAICAGPADLRGGLTPGSVVIAAGPAWRGRLPTGHWHLTIRVRGASPERGRRHRSDAADIVVDLADPAWPVIRHIGAWFTHTDAWYRTETQAFFAARAATWDTESGDDLTAYAAAVTEAAIPTGANAIDVGCGTGRALPALRDAVGAAGTVLGVDLTPAMIDVARSRAHAADAALALADVRRLPLPGRAVDAVFAAGLLPHLPDTDAGLRELARVTRPGGRLVIFHPSGRTDLAGCGTHPGDPLAETSLRLAAHRTGWHLTGYDDPPHRFLALATRR